MQTEACKDQKEKCMEFIIENLTKSFGTKEVLKDISFTFESGKIYGLLGRNGAGKTTLFNCVNKDIKSESGSFYLDDGKKEEIKPEDIGYVLSTPTVPAFLTGREFIKFFIEINEKSITGLRPIDEYFDMMNIEKGDRDRLLKDYSHGMKNKMQMLVNIIARPPVLLLDEPLGALDLRLRKDMQNELKRIQQQMGITFIYVTHDQEEALTMSDTVVVMDKGRIQQIGTPEDIYNEPKNAFVADFIGESNILNGTMVRDNVVKMYGKEFPCVDGGFAENEPVDVVIRPEDIDIVPVEQGQLVGTVTNVTFKGMQYDIIVDFRGFKWLIQTTDHSPVGARIGVKIDPEGFHIMKKSEYSGMFGDYSSYSEEYEELADASAKLEEEESEDEE